MTSCRKFYFDSKAFNKIIHIWFQDGSLPFARSIKDIHSEFRLLSKLTELLMNEGEQEEALQYATLAVQIAGKTGTSMTFSKITTSWLLVPFYGDVKPAALTVRQQAGLELLCQQSVVAFPQECMWKRGQRTTGWLKSTTACSSMRWQKTTTSSPCPFVHLFCSTLRRLATTQRSTADWAISLCTNWRYRRQMDFCVYSCMSKNIIDSIFRYALQTFITGIFQYFWSGVVQGYLGIVSLSVHGHQWCHFKKKWEEITAPDISTVVLQTGWAGKCFLATFAHASLKNQYQFDCMLNLGFSHHFSLPPDSCFGT